MILIADSGSSKSDWVLIDDSGNELSFRLAGLNPYYVSANETIDILSKDLTPFIEAKKVNELFFYGAGCSSVLKCMVLEEAFKKLFKNAEVYIESDLFGAARALLGNDKGLACILGTGSNACYYDGEKIVDKIVSLGYLFADEGSGAYMGKQFIKDFLLGNLPEELSSVFKQKYNYSRENILEAVYNLPFPNRFLASFTTFYTEHISNPYIFDLVSNSFREFFINQVEKFPNYKDLPLAFTGSVSYYFEAILQQVASEFGMKIFKVVKAPIKSLALYHKSNA